MEKICMIALLLLYSVVVISISGVEGVDKSPKAIEKWFEQLNQKKEIMTKLRFFLHETNGGKYGKTFYRVVDQNISSTFGRIVMFDDALKVGADLESKIIGRAQRCVDLSSFSEISLTMTMNFVFTSGKYNDSTLSVAGRNPLYDEYRELAIVGGSGVFRLARGIASTQTILKDEVNGDIIAEYNVFIIHYDTLLALMDHMIPVMKCEARTLCNLL